MCNFPESESIECLMFYNYLQNINNNNECSTIICLQFMILQSFSYLFKQMVCSLSLCIYLSRYMYIYIYPQEHVLIKYKYSLKIPCMCTYKHTCTHKHREIFLFCFLLLHTFQIFMTKTLHGFLFFKFFFQADLRNLSFQCDYRQQGPLQWIVDALLLYRKIFQWPIILYRNKST